MNQPADLIFLDRTTSGGPSVSNLLSPTPRVASTHAPVDRLCQALDRAFDESADTDEPSHRAAFAQTIRTALADAVADATLLTPAQREAAADSYRRHLLAADPLGRYAVAALVWMPGQASRVHAHHTWCGYAVVDGTLTETVYGWVSTEQCASEVRTHPRASGAVSFTRAGHTGIHRLGNASDAPAISLHVYGVPGAQIATHVNDFVRIACQG